MLLFAHIKVVRSPVPREILYISGTGIFSTSFRYGIDLGMNMSRMQYISCIFCCTALWEAGTGSLPEVLEHWLKAWPLNTFSLIQISLHQDCISSNQDEWMEASQWCQEQWETLLNPIRKGHHLKPHH